jgi:class 3 adenylate cyclase/CHASE2 domain-containing sensor protein
MARLEWITYDWRVRQANRLDLPVCTNLGFVPITDESVKRVGDGSLGKPYGLYWPRQIYGKVVRELNRQGAKVVAFDILFAGLRPDHTEEFFMPDGSTVKSDEYFAIQVRKAGNVVLASEKGVLPPSLFRTNSNGLGDISAERDADGILRRARAFTTYREWHPVFQQISEDPLYGINLAEARIEAGQSTNELVFPRSGGLPTMRIPLNKEGEFDLADLTENKIPPGMKRFAKPFTEERMWHMGIILAARQLDLDLQRAMVNLEEGWILLTGTNGTNGIKRVIPVDSEGRFFVNWSLTTHDKDLAQEPFDMLLEQDMEHHGHTNSITHPKAPHADWRDKLVIIGSTTTGNDLTDVGATPLEESTFLVSVHWNVANSLIMGNFIQRSPLSVELFLVVLMGLLGAYITWVFRSYVASLWVLILFILYVVVAVFAFVRHQYWIPIVPPLIGGVLMTHFCMLGYLVFFEQFQRRRMRSLFDKMVSPSVVSEVLDTEGISATGAPRRVTVFFSDIRGFTELTDTNQQKAEEFIRARGLTGDAARKIREAVAEETLQTVNTYLRAIANVVLKNGGEIDKFIGDCVMAFWGASHPENPKHALNCVNAARETQQFILKMNRERELENVQREEANKSMNDPDVMPLQPLPLLRVGTGINTGQVTAGYMGTDDRLNYTIFGREVNLASRLETVSGHARIIISQETLIEIRKFDPALADSCKPLPPEMVKGIRNPVPIFEVPWEEADPKDENAPEKPD